jgi:hypothetical protein
MIRKSIVSFTLAVLSLAISAPFALGQQQTAKLPKQNPFMSPTKDPNSPVGAALRAALTKSKANASSSNHNNGQQLQTFTYTVTSSRDGNTYSGEIVGRNPFTNPLGFTAISTQLIPVVIVTNSVFAGVDPTTHAVLTAPGVTTFNPTVADDSCLTAPNDVPIKLVQQSPIVQPFDFNFGGLDVGDTQTTDAFQRANFFKVLNLGKVQFDDNFVYHVVLSPLKTISAIVINVPAADGVAYPSAAFGGCNGGNIAIIDIAFYEPALESLFSALASQGVNPSTFPLFTLHNVVECEGNTPGCGTLNSGACCILGFHDIDGSQTFGTADFDTSEIFLNPVPDVSVMSHEVGEWMNDPNGANPTPPWGHIGQQPGCQNNLEVGDPLSGTIAPPIFNPKNGFTYHMQELVFFSWFYGAPSVGANGWFSNNATFLTDAGPVCQ